MSWTRDSIASICFVSSSRFFSSAFSRFWRFGSGSAFAGFLGLLRPPELQEDGVRVEVIVAAALEVLVVGPPEVVEPLRRDLDDPVREPGDEPAVVRDEDERPVVLVQRRDEGLDRLDVEVVRRLVEDEDVGAEDREAGEDEARALAAGEGADAACRRRRP